MSFIPALRSYRYRADIVSALRLSWLSANPLKGFLLAQGPKATLIPDCLNYALTIEHNGYNNASFIVCPKISQKIL